MDNFATEELCLAAGDFSCGMFGTDCTTDCPYGSPVTCVFVAGMFGNTWVRQKACTKSGLLASGVCDLRAGGYWKSFEFIGPFNTYDEAYHAIRYYNTGHGGGCDTLCGDHGYYMEGLCGGGTGWSGAGSIVLLDGCYHVYCCCNTVY
jgi:hypothetical protein